MIWLNKYRQESLLYHGPWANADLRDFSPSVATVVRWAEAAYIWPRVSGVMPARRRSASSSCLSRATSASARAARVYERFSTVTVEPEGDTTAASAMDNSKQSPVRTEVVCKFSSTRLATFSSASASLASLRDSTTGRRTRVSERAENNAKGMKAEPRYVQSRVRVR